MRVHTPGLNSFSGNTWVLVSWRTWENCAVPTATSFKCVNLTGLQKNSYPGVTNHSVNQYYTQPVNNINFPCWQSNVCAQRLNGHDCWTTEPLFYRAILIEKRMKIKNPVNKVIWRAVLTSNQEKIIFRASNYQSLSIKLRGGRTQGKQHNKVKTVILKTPLQIAARKPMDWVRMRRNWSTFLLYNTVLWVPDSMSTTFMLFHTLPKAETSPRNIFRMTVAKK